MVTRYHRHIGRTNRCRMPMPGLSASLPAASLSPQIRLPAPLAWLMASNYLVCQSLWSIGERFCMLNRIFSLRSGRMPWPRCGSGQPALAAPVVLQVAIGFAGADFVEPEIELLDVGVLPQRFGGTLENDAAVLHDIAAVGDIERHGGVLLDQEHGQAALFAQPADDPEDLLDEPRRQAERGLVEQNHLGLGHQRPADHQHLLLAARKITRGLVAALPQRRKDVVDAADAFADCSKIAARMGPGDEIVLDRQILENPSSLEDLGHAAFDDRVRRQTVEPLPVELDRALGDLPALGAQQPRYRLQRRGLSGPVGAEQRRDAALLGEQRHTLQHQDHAVIDDFDIVERQHRVCLEPSLDYSALATVAATTSG